MILKSEKYVGFTKLTSPTFEKNIEPLYNADKTNGPVLIGFQEIKNFESRFITTEWPIIKSGIYPVN